MDKPCQPLESADLARLVVPTVFEDWTADGFYRRQPIVCTAAVVEQQGRVLLLRKPDTPEWPGSWVFPGGKLNYGEDPAAGAARELAEETGIALRPDVFVFRRITNVVSPRMHMIGLVYFVAGMGLVAINREPDRHVDLGWFPWDALPEPLMAGVLQYLGRPEVRGG